MVETKKYCLSLGLRRMMEHDVVFLFTMCPSRKDNIYLHPSCLCHLSLRTKLHVNTSNPQATAKCQLSSVRISGNRFLNTKKNKPRSCCVSPFAPHSKARVHICSMMSRTRVWMHTVMFDLLNDVSALPVI